jgi:hypothetical protein
MIYLLDCDMHGTDSIADELATGQVEVFECVTFKDFQNAVQTLLYDRNVGPDDTVVIDPLTTLLDTARMNAKLGTDPKTDYFEKGKSKFMEGDKQYLNVYNFAQSVAAQPINNLRARKANIIVIAHEKERFNDQFGMKMREPDVNPAYIGTLKARGSEVFRLKAVREDILGPDGAVAVPRDTRVLYLRSGEDFECKFNVARSRSESIPKYLLNPTMPKLIETLGKRPVFLVLYGHPGAGKTTFAVSDIQTHKEKK